MKNKIKWLVFSLVIIGFGFCQSASADIVDRIVAIVDTDIVTLVQLNKETAPYIKNIETAAYSPEKKKEMIQTVTVKMLDSLIDRSLTQQEAKKYRIDVSDAEIDAAIENVKKTRSISQEDLEKALYYQGVSLKEYRENIEKQILQGRLINQAVKSKVIITESDIKKEYEANAEKYSGKKKYHLRNILMENETAINEVKNKLDEKENFASLAQQYSNASNAKDGGDLGTFDIHNFSDNLKESISKLNKGEYTNVISTTQGFQIFYIEDIVQEGGKTYEQAHDEIHESLYREQVEKKFATWLESLKKKAHIKVLL